MSSLLESIKNNCDWRTILATISVIQFVNWFRSIFVYKVRNTPDVVTKSDNCEAMVKAYLFPFVGDSFATSPFTNKLTMFMRLTGIPHTCREADHNKAPKSKIPYIKHDGNVIGDSQLIIRYLENTYDVNKMSMAVAEKNGAAATFVPFDHLSTSQQSTCEMIRLMCEGDIYWAIVNLAWGGSDGIAKTEKAWRNTEAAYFAAIPKIVRLILTPIIRVSVMRDAWGQGLARHSPNDQLYLAKRALRTLSNTLGDKKYLLSNEIIAECDCIAFGVVESIINPLTPNELYDYVMKDCANLHTYAKNIEKQVYADRKPQERLPAGVESGPVFAKNKS